MVTQVRSLPTVLAFKDGKVVNQFVGALPEPHVKKCVPVPTFFSFFFFVLRSLFFILSFFGSTIIPIITTFMSYHTLPTFLPFPPKSSSIPSSYINIITPHHIVSTLYSYFVFRISYFIFHTVVVVVVLLYIDQPGWSSRTH